jgi:hypothetical protein
MNDEDDFNDIDTLMALDPMQLSTEPNAPGRRDLDRIIAYQRNQRAKREAGIKPRKPKVERPAGQSIEELLSFMPKPPPKPKPAVSVPRSGRRF